MGLGASQATCYVSSLSNNQVFALLLSTCPSNGLPHSLDSLPSCITTYQGNGNVDCNSKNLEEAKGKMSGGFVMRGEMQIKLLDDVGPQRDVKALKMDVEGHEPFVMRGAKNFFSRHTVWFMV